MALASAASVGGINISIGNDDAAGIGIGGIVRIGGIGIGVGIGVSIGVGIGVGVGIIVTVILSSLLSSLLTANGEWREDNEGCSADATITSLLSYHRRHLECFPTADSPLMQQSNLVVSS